MAPMVIGVWCGESKPPLNEYLMSLISELKDILINGISIGFHHITIKFGRIHCDTPARSHMKGV